MHIHSHCVVYRHVCIHVILHSHITAYMMMLQTSLLHTSAYRNMTQHTIAFCCPPHTYMTEYFTSCIHLVLHICTLHTDTYSHIYTLLHTVLIRIHTHSTLMHTQHSSPFVCAWQLHTRTFTFDSSTCTHHCILLEVGHIHTQYTVCRWMLRIAVVFSQNAESSQCSCWMDTFSACSWSSENAAT